MNFPKDDGVKRSENLPPVGQKAHHRWRAPFNSGSLILNLLFDLICIFNMPYFAHFPSLLTHHAVPVVSPVTIEVGQVTVFVPPGAAVGQSAVTQRNVVIRVNSGPGPALVVRHSITWRTRAAGKNNTCLLHFCRRAAHLSYLEQIVSYFFCFPVIVSCFIYCSAQRCLPLSTIYSHTHFLFCRSPSFSLPFVFPWQRKSNKMPNIEQSIICCTLWLSLSPSDFKAHWKPCLLLIHASPYSYCQ